MDNRCWAKDSLYQNQARRHYESLHDSALSPQFGERMGPALALAAESLTRYGYDLCAAAFPLQLHILPFLEKLPKEWVLS